MNKPLTDAELQLRMMQHSAEVVQTINSIFTEHATRQRLAPRQRGEACDEYITGCERKAMEIFYPALAAFRSAIQDAQALTDVRKSAFKDLTDVLDDYAPNRDKWEEDVQRERIAGL